MLMQESEVMLSPKGEDAPIVHIPLESSKPVQASKAHDPR